MTTSLGFEINILPALSKLKGLISKIISIPMACKSNRDEPSYSKDVSMCTVLVMPSWGSFNGSDTVLLATISLRLRWYNPRLHPADWCLELPGLLGVYGCFCDLLYRQRYPMAWRSWFHLCQTATFDNKWLRVDLSGVFVSRVLVATLEKL